MKPRILLQVLVVPVVLALGNAVHRAPVPTAHAAPSVEQQVGSIGVSLRFERALKPAFPVSSLSFSLDGKSLLATGTHPEIKKPRGVMQMWDAQRWKLLKSVVLTQPAPYAAFSPDGKRIASAHGKSIRLWNAPGLGPVPVKISTQKMSQVDQVAWSPDGRALAAAARWDGFFDKQGYFVKGFVEARVWDAHSGVVLYSFRRSDDHGWAGGPQKMHVAFLPDGTSLAVSNMEATRIWDWKTGKLQKVVADAGDRVLWAPDGRSAASVYSVLLGPHADTKELRLLNPDTLVSVKSLTKAYTDTEGPEYADIAAFSPDSRILAGGVSAREQHVKLWDAQTGQVLADLVLNNPDGFTHALAFSPDGKYLARGSEKAITIFRVERE